MAIKINFQKAYLKFTHAMPESFQKLISEALRSVNYSIEHVLTSILSTGVGGQWRKMGNGEFAFFVCQTRHFSPIFDFGISHLTDFYTANRHKTLNGH